jgi:hypothetical protein
VWPFETSTAVATTTLVVTVSADTTGAVTSGLCVCWHYRNSHKWSVSTDTTGTLTSGQCVCWHCRNTHKWSVSPDITGTLTSGQCVCRHYRNTHKWSVCLPTLQEHSQVVSVSAESAWWWVLSEWRCVGLVVPGVSKERSAFIFRGEGVPVTVSHEHIIICINSQCTNNGNWAAPSMFTFMWIST